MSSLERENERLQHRIAHLKDVLQRAKPESFLTYVTRSSASGRAREPFTEDNQLSVYSWISTLTFLSYTLKPSFYQSWTTLSWGNCVQREFLETWVHWLHHQLNNQELSGIQPIPIPHCPLFINTTLLTVLLPVGTKLGLGRQFITCNSFHGY